MSSITYSIQTIIDFFKDKLAESTQANKVLTYFTEHHLLLLLVAALVGLLITFAGHKFIKLIIALGGLSVGAWGGFLLTSKLLTHLSATLSLAIIVVFGIVGMCLAAKLVKFGIFAASAWLAYKFIAPLCNVTIANFISEKAEVNVPVNIISVAVAVVIGLLALALTRLILIICTSVGGGYITAFYGAAMLTEGNFLGEGVVIKEVYILGVAAVLALLGLLTQFKNGKKRG